MKKGIIVLLITVLAAGMAFAGVTGKAATQFTFNLDEGKGYGFGDANPQEMKYTFSFQIDAATVDKADHQTDIWAEIGAEAKASIATKNAKEKGDLTAKIDTLKLTKANIHINDITIDILGPQGFFDYASSFTTKKYGSYTGPCFDMTSDDPLFGTSVDAGGVNVLYDGYTFAFAFNNKVTNAVDAVPSSNGEFKWFKAGDNTTGYVAVAPTVTANGYTLYVKANDVKDPIPAKENMVLYVGAETKAYDLAEGATLQAAANFNLNRDMKTEKNAIKAGGSVDVAYDADEFSAGVAVDGMLSVSEAEKKTIGLDVLANAKYSIASGKVYFGMKKVIDVEGLDKVLEAQVSAAIPVEENTITVTALAERMLKEDHGTSKAHFNEKWAGYSVDANAAFGDLSVGAGFGWNVGVKSDAKGNPTRYGMKISANASYALEVAKIKGSVSVNFADVADEITFYAVKPSISVESSSIVENCTLSLGWSDALIAGEKFKTEKSNGKIVAAATIAF